MNKTAVEQAARQLVSTIQISEPYREYCEAYEKVKNDPEKWASVNMIRKVFFETAEETDSEKLKTKLNALHEKHESLLSQKWLVDFMEKEQRYCKMVQMVQSCLDEVMDFDMSFLKNQE